MSEEHREWLSSAMGVDRDEPPEHLGNHPDGSCWTASRCGREPAPRPPYAPAADDDSKLVKLDLTWEERTLLCFGLKDWLGPASGTESLAVAFGFANLDDLADHGDQIAEAIFEGEAVSRRDWSRAMFAAEVCFASDVVGTGKEFTVIHGGSDADWFRALRDLQGKIHASRKFLGP